MATANWNRPPTTAAQVMIGLVLMLWGVAAGEAGSTQVSGMWRGLQGLELVAADIDGKSVTVVLPKLDFTAPIDRRSMREQLRGAIKQQKAVFHLYANDLRQPLKKNGMLFATDVYLQDLKMTFVGLLRQMGCSFTVSKSSAFDDDVYLRKIQNGVEDGENGTGAATGSGSGSGSGSASAGTASATMAAAAAAAMGGGAVATSFDSVPARVVPPSVRRMKAEIEARVAALKNKPYKSSPLKIDGLRWASGRMGNLQADGAIKGGEIEGVQTEFLAPVPGTKTWWSEKTGQELTGQPCEYIILRTRDGAELKKGGRLALNDIYFTDLGTTWAEWLEQQGVKEKPVPITDPEMATGPIVLKVKVVRAVWLGVNGNNSIKVRFHAPDLGLTGEEIVRAPLSKLESQWTAEIGKKLDARLKGLEVDITLLMSPRETWYTEMGCKKTNQLYFPKLQTNLAHVLAELTGKE